MYLPFQGHGESLALDLQSPVLVSFFEVLGELQVSILVDFQFLYLEKDINNKKPHYWGFLLLRQETKKNI